MLTGLHASADDRRSHIRNQQDVIVAQPWAMRIFTVLRCMGVGCDVNARCWQQQVSGTCAVRGSDKSLSSEVGRQQQQQSDY